jgi:hypothetical protein
MKFFLFKASFLFLLLTLTFNFIVDNPVLVFSQEPEEEIAEEEIIEEYVENEEIAQEEIIEVFEEEIIETNDAEYLDIDPVVVLEKKEEPKEKLISETTRVYKKNIYIDKEANYECKAEFFKVDISNKNKAIKTLLLTRGADISYEIEIGSLPAGIDVKFSENDDYHKKLGLSETSIDVVITKNNSAQKGNFSIPIIYTQKGIADASVICQMNIVNL